MRISNRTTSRVVPAVSLAFLLSGCAIFGPVGEWFSQGYENTVSYFNAYYNAKRLFTEAEDEIIASNLSLRGKSQQTPSAVPIPNTAKQKLTLVIDKCSNILSFSPTSSLVDDALFLIGKANFYQGEYVKAERKFSELLAQFPNGPLTLDAQLWFLKTLYRLDRFEDAGRAGELLLEAATAAEESAIAGEACVTLGEVAEEQNNASLAVEWYGKGIEALEDGFQRATIQARIGDILLELKEYQPAMMAYQKVGGYTTDLYLLYYGRFQAARAARELEDHGQALAILDDLLGDFRFQQYESIIRYEIGKTLAFQGQTADAVHQFRFVDTTYARTEVGTKAAFELGKLLQYEVGDYVEAKVAYDHASSLPALEESRLAQKRNVALAKYFDLQNKFFVVDSLFMVHDNDSLWPAPDTSTMVRGATPPLEQVERADSTVLDSILVSETESAAMPDTVSADSTTSFASHKQMPSDSLSADSTISVVLPQRLKPDSLRTVLSGIAYELGELFYSELEIPDSAFFWYNQSLKLHQDSLRTGRTLFILAEIIRSNPGKDYGDADEIYRQLIREAPESPYAEEARIRLGIPKRTKDIDPAETAFAQAESLLTSGKEQAALEAWKELIQQYPRSPFAAKSDLALGWLYEKHLSQPDSALAHYKLVVERHGTSVYAKAAQRRIANAEEVPAQAVPDSLSKTPAKPLEPEKPKIEIDPGEERSLKARSDTSRTRRGQVRKEDH
ncbi:MAG: tetratricopeptide repeat protein [Ignavibacteriales bacterium]|nr:tetratricopeptide repeat protein [Ignavibacteriales bacterium]